MVVSIKNKKKNILNLLIDGLGQRQIYFLQ
ncbi:hypothetical protein JGUZn3_17700 [Entomobacter blattae]|uniref:Uncharacterized protein n=1 Tax=Entomobacter blattae TaxID=2762277 RepID=A0A7H1NT77_9PROT|nr:hypothetical protein JGUZn3_17700 [Entomobacter blattae]